MQLKRNTLILACLLPSVAGLILIYLAAILTLFLGKRIPKILERLNYKYLSLAIITFVTSMVFFLTGLMGLLILFTSVSIGLFCAYLEIKRSHCMGVLLLPSILSFAELNPLIISILRI
jgi:putative membrane protein